MSDASAGQQPRDGCQRYYGVRHSQHQCIPGDWDDEKIDLLIVFEKREDAKAAARLGAARKNEAYYAGYSIPPIEEHPDGWLHRGETQHRMFAVRAIDVEGGDGEKDGSDGCLWAIVEGQDGIESFFRGTAEEAARRFDQVVEKRRALGASDDEEWFEGYGDALQVVEVDPVHGTVAREVCLATKINPDFEAYSLSFGTDELRDYVKSWTPKIDCTVRLVRIPIEPRALTEGCFQSATGKLWSNELKNTDAKWEVLSRCALGDKSKILADLEKYIAENE